MGTPSDSFYFSNGVYQRDFTKGIWLVNPTTSTATVNLGESYTRLGGVVMNSITLRPDQEDVLVN